MRCEHDWNLDKLISLSRVSGQEFSPANSCSSLKNPECAAELPESVS